MKKQSIQVGIALLKKILFMLALIGDISFCVLYIVWGVHHYVSPEEFMKVHAGFIGLAVIAALCMLFEVPRMMFSVKVSGTTFRVRNGLVPYTAEASQLKRIRCYTRSKRGNVYYCISLQFSGKRSVELRKGMSNFIRFATYLDALDDAGELPWNTIESDSKRKLLEFVRGEFGENRKVAPQKSDIGVEGAEADELLIQLRVKEIQHGVIHRLRMVFACWLALLLLSAGVCIFCPEEYLGITCPIAVLILVLLIPVLIYIVWKWNKHKNEDVYEIQASFVMKNSVLYMNGYEASIHWEIFTERFVIYKKGMEVYFVDGQDTKRFQLFLETNGIPFEKEDSRKS